MDNRVLFEVLISAEAGIGYEARQGGKVIDSEVPIRDTHTIHVYTAEGALVAGKKALDWLTGWRDKEILSVKKVGGMVLIDK